MERVSPEPVSHVQNIKIDGNADKVYLSKYESFPQIGGVTFHPSDYGQSATVVNGMPCYCLSLELDIMCSSMPNLHFVPFETVLLAIHGFMPIIACS